MKAKTVTPKKPAAEDPAPKPETTIVAHDPAKLPGRLRMIGGSASDEWNNLIIANVAIRALWLAQSDEAGRKQLQTAVVAGLVGISPKDELEGMMAAQLIAAHLAAMECYRRAMIPDQTFAGRSESLTQANKLSRTHAALVEALSRYRGKGQQKVTVEHVHVHAGGQAVVGTVETVGGEATRLSKDQTHAQLAHAPQSEMPSQNAARDPMPVAGDAERSLPDARRRVTGGAEGE